MGLLAQVGIGVLMVGIGIGSAPLWFDELASISVAGRPAPDIFELTRDTDANMGLYYLVLHVWLGAGDSEAWVRSLSAIPAVAAIPATAILARRLFGDSVGLASGFMLAASLFVVANAQNARAYTLAMLLVTLATLFFVEAVRNNRLSSFIAYGAASALAVYASPLAGLVLASHAVSLSFLPQVRAVLRPFVLTYAAVLVSLAPLAAIMFAAGGEQVDFLARPGPGDVLDIAGETLAMGNLPLALVCASILAVGLFVLWRQGSGDSGERDERRRWKSGLMVGWAALPALVLFAYSQLDPLFMARYLITSAPAFAIIAAIGLVALARRSRTIGALTALLLIGLTVQARVGLDSYGDAYKQGWAEGDLAAARTVTSRSIAGDGILYLPSWQRLSVELHLEREAGAGSTLPVDFAVTASAEELNRLYARVAPPALVVKRLLGHRRVWLLRWDSPEGEPAPGVGPEALHSEFRRVLRRDYGELQLELYRRKPGR